MEFRAVILAAGESKRMGAQKLLLPFRGRPMIEYAVEAARAWSPLAVAGAPVAAHLRECGGCEVVRNDEPARGMSYSLKLANEAVEPDRALIVLLGDKPLVTHQLVDRVIAAFDGADIVFPKHPGTNEPGHPVIFSPRARAKIPLLPDGDSLRDLRDDPALIRRTLATGDRGAYVDIDTAAAFEA